jgi:cytochrome c oxidase cbb3-type subunit 3
MCCRCRVPRTIRPGRPLQGEVRDHLRGLPRPDGKGNQALGAPNLTDNVWLYGGGSAVVQTITNGARLGEPLTGQSAMPAWKDTLTPAQIHLVTAYVWSLSNSAGAA